LNQTELYLNPASSEWAVDQQAAVLLDRYGHADKVAALVARLLSRGWLSGRGRR
jgi:hypothetical protein